MADLSVLGDRILEARERAALTRDDLAARLGVSLGAVMKWETGQRLPPIDVLCQLADALAVTTAWLLGRVTVEVSGDVTTVRDLGRELGLSVGQMNGFVERGDLHVTKRGWWRFVDPAEAAAFRAFIRTIEVPPADRLRGAYCQSVPGGRCICRCHAMRRVADEGRNRAVRVDTWRTSHDEVIKALVSDGHGPEYVAEQLSVRFSDTPRTTIAVRQRIRKLGLSIRVGWASGSELSALLGVARRRVAQYEAQGLLTRAEYGRWRRYRLSDVDALVRVQAGITINPRFVRDPKWKALAEVSAIVNKRRQTG